MRRKIIESTLDKLFPNPQIPLDHDDPYTLLIATLLSAQCTDKKVNEVTPDLFKRAKTPYEMVKLPLDEIISLIHPCGLCNKKGKAIVDLSQILIEKYNGQVPSTLSELESLPGVGHKTASCIVINCFHQAAFPVDTHIHRLAKRFKISNGKSVIETEKDLKVFFLKKNWAKLHLQLIYYARAYCKAKDHQIENCPICNELFYNNLQ